MQGRRLGRPVARLFLAGLLVSLVLWFAADWLAQQLFADDLAQFVFSFVLATMGGAVVMMVLRIRAVRSGRYEKARWGVRRTRRY
jgi:hypothetical protein